MNKKYIGLLSIAAFSLAIAASSGAIYPSGVGTYNAWTPSTGSTHYTLVDEVTCNGTTDYVSTTVAGNRDSYTVSLSSVPDGAVITGITIAPCASRAQSAKTAVLNVFYRLNGTNSADLGSYSLTGTTPVDLASTTFSGLSVYKNASTSLEIGAVRTSGSGGARLSRLTASVTYETIPVAPNNLSGSAISYMASGTTMYYTAMTWSDNSNNESNFVLERGVDGVTFPTTYNLSANTTSYNNYGVASGTTYYYRIKAINAAGSSDYSSTTSVVIP